MSPRARRRWRFRERHECPPQVRITVLTLAGVPVFGPFDSGYLAYLAASVTEPLLVTADTMLRIEHVPDAQAWKKPL